MPQTRDCDFCGDEIPPGTGTMFVRTDGSAIHYCSSKCEKNADLGREPRDVEWVQDEAAEELRRAEEGDVPDDEGADDDGQASAEESGEDQDAIEDETPEDEEATSDDSSVDEADDEDAQA